MSPFRTRVRAAQRHVGQLGPVRSVISRRLVAKTTPNDIVLVHYPKSGSSWLRAMLALSLGATEVDYDQLRRWIPPIGGDQSGALALPGYPQNRIVHTHAPLKPSHTSALRYLYLIREPIAVLRSYSRHEQIQGRPLDFDSFSERFIHGAIDSYGNWADHVRTGCDTSHQQGSHLVVDYDRLKSDPHHQMERLLSWAGIPADSDDIKGIVAKASREQMRSASHTSDLHRSLGQESFVAAEDSEHYTLEVPNRLANDMAQLTDLYRSITTDTPT